MYFDFDSNFLDKNIKYAVFVGRFQPFLYQTHFEYCLKNLLKANLKVILFFGSSDLTFLNSNKKINFLNNPLNDSQRFNQFKIITDKFLDDKKDDILFGGFLEDKFDNHQWFLNLQKKLNEFFVDYHHESSIKNCVFFRVSKDDDPFKDKKLAADPLSDFDEKIKLSDFAGILSPILQNSQNNLLNISATKFRRLDIFSEEFKKNILAHNYIKELVIKTRNNSFFKNYLNNQNVKLTMLDLSLARFFKEDGLKHELLFNQNIKDVAGLENFLKSLV